MNPIRRKYDIAGLFVMVSGLLCLPIFLLEGWNPRSKAFLIIGIIALILGFLLRKRKRWLAYVVYLLILLIVLVTLLAMGTSPIGVWWWVLILILQALAAISLFRILWADK